MEEKRFEHYLFDMDGTLFDTSEGVINSLIYGLKHYGIEERPRDWYKKFIGPPLLWSYTNFCGFDEATAKEAMKFYREYYADNGIFECRPYDGIPELLKELKDSGRRLYVATSKPQVFTERILEKFGFAGFFTRVCGSDMDEKHSEKAEIIARVLEGCAKDSALMIGDRHYDIAGARANGIASCGVLFGFGTRQEFEEAGANFIVSSPKEVLALLPQNLA